MPTGPERHPGTRRAILGDSVSHERAERPREEEAAAPPSISLLYVATVSHTICRFLVPYGAHFRALGWRVTAAASGVDCDSDLRASFDDLYEIPFSRSVIDVRGLVRGGRAISRVLGASAHDIVHVHTPIAAFITRSAAHRLSADRRPLLVYTAHGFHFHRRGHLVPNAAFVTAEKLAGRWTDLLVVINDEDYEAARRYRIVSPSRLVRMPGIGIDTDAFSRSSIQADAFVRVRRDLGVDPDAPLFVVVGELNRNKRTDVAIRSLAVMRHTDAQLVHVGAGPLRSRLKALAVKMGVGDRVHFGGFVEDVRPLIGSATALVLPSQREGLSRSIMEALALEVPVVASTARGNGELVDSDSGFVVPIGDVRGFAARMDWLVDHPDEAHEMGRRGRARMTERYDLRLLIQQHEAAYRALLADVERRRRRA